MFNKIKSAFPDSYVERFQNDYRYSTGNRIKKAFPELELQRDTYGGDRGFLTETPAENLNETTIDFNTSKCKQLVAYKYYTKQAKISETINHTRFEQDDSGEESDFEEDSFSPPQKTIKVPPVQDKNEKIHVINHSRVDIKVGDCKYREPESLWIIAPSKATFKAFMWYCKYFNFVEPAKANYIYRWQNESQRWVQKLAYERLEKSSVFGMDKVFEDIALDMRILKEKSHTVLKKVGRTASLNYLLYGDPGTGKTSTIKAIGSMYNMDIYIASFNQHVNEDIIQRIMTPIVTKNVLLLVEDFDRYLTSETSSRQVSSFLNALDGVEPSDGVIRFFTANDPSVIAENKALLSRMQRIIKYGAPSADSIAKRVLQIFENAPEELVTRFSNESEKRQLSLRDVTNLLCRNMFRENGLQDSLNQIDDFAQEKILYPHTQGSKKQEE